VITALMWMVALFGSVRGITHDSRHRPIPAVQITLRSATSDWQQTTVTDAKGEFQCLAVPVGNYVVSASLPGLNTPDQRITVHSGDSPVLHFPMSVATVNQTVEVTASAGGVNQHSSTTESIVSRHEIELLPGADRTNSLAMITDTVPGSYIVHDQIHIRGGHQAGWLINGVPVPNTNIASNVGPQFDPKDIDYLEVQRGGLTAEYGDRTFGIFNIVPNTGFERNSDAEIVLSYGSYNESNNQISIGGHSKTFAYYASVTGSRTDLGLETPVPEVSHDLASNVGGFTSLIYNPGPADQLRLIASARRDHYQIPDSPEDEAAGRGDVQNERDTLMILSWVRTLGPGKLLTVSPVYHSNRAAFEGGPDDSLAVVTDDRTSSYAGGQSSLSIVTGKHSVRFGLFGFDQSDRQVFRLHAAHGSSGGFDQYQEPSGNMITAFAEEQFKIMSWLTLNGGVRWTRFSGLLSETATDPRIGIAVSIPHLNWVLRVFYGRYYQPPPLSTVSGPLEEIAVELGFRFLPLRGERDEVREFGLAIPFRGWTVDLADYRTIARNFFDHDVLGNSNFFLPLTIAQAHLRGIEAKVVSPTLFRTTQFHLAAARQYALGQGGVTGGLTDFRPASDELFYLDHDQRYTLNAGAECTFLRRMWGSVVFAYGSGFLNGDGPEHMPGHTSVDLAGGISFGDNFSLRVTALNIANSRFLLDNSNTFGGTHWNFPRQVSVSLRYRFHY
jgi:hypothetical protein